MMEEERQIPTISTGEPSTLKTYRKIALTLSMGDKSSKAVKFFDEKIAEQGEDEVVIQAESQVMYLIAKMLGVV